MNVEPGQRWRMPNGDCWQIIRYSTDDTRNVFVAPVIDGVLCSRADDIEEFTAQFFLSCGNCYR